MRISDRAAVSLMRIIGVALLLIGVASALLGPAETYVFQLFEDGGQFHYEGFGFGSLMFANIVIQIAGYYVIAALCIPLGYAHLRLRWWARPAMTTLLIDWLIVGLPLSLVASMILVTSKRVSPAGLALAVLGFLLLYPILPIVLLSFYRSKAARRVFRDTDAPPSWFSDTPESVRVAASLLALMVLILHFPLLLGGIFPFFGRTVLGLPGVIMIDLALAAAAVLTWGAVRRRYWAWWCATAFLGLMTVSSTVTFLANPPHQIVAAISFAPLEAEALSRVPMQGYHLALLAGAIPAATFVAVAVSRRAWLSRRRHRGLTPATHPPRRP